MECYVDRQGDSGRFEQERQGRGGDGRPPARGGKPRRVDGNRHSRQYVKGRLGRNQPLHHRAAACRQRAHAGGAEYRARPAPALRQAHRGEGGRLVAYRRPRQVSGNY